jgi:LacI family transcriptional regulator
MTNATRTRRPRRQVLLLQSWWEDRVLRGVASYAAQQGWILDCHMRWAHQLPEPGAWHGDGIIAYCGIVRPMRDLVEFIRNANVPVVETQGVRRLAQSVTISISHEAIGRLAAEHLLSLGFHHLGFVSFDKNIIERRRRNGFAEAVKAANRQFHALDFSRLAAHLSSLPKPLGLMAANDANALSVIIACQDAGFSVPEEIAVVGVDDTDILCDLAAIPLTSVNCNFEQLGYEAARLLDRLMDGGHRPRNPIVLAPSGVTVRRSTDTISIPDLDSTRFLRFLRDHFREPLSLEQSALDLGVSLRRVQNHFRVHVGRTLIQELTRLRVVHAKKLLPDRKLKLEVIATESGFSNRFHFIRSFERVTGMTPKRWRATIAESPTARS